ncbi:hypothetical protein OQJ19_09330 [Fluoribacter gormanii]|uniref:Coiled-coil protein n=1 Tax=Fluoribacter gormanii TaxID=464 RepID=A0A377GMI8_9GAMM|nr:hypothetical protein [Fluoribacter gormanii]KTD05100.1 coiled-coil protein [Fluoribacter gormanii]MCW8445600.1 hypothetical protein [Fluoribacter gormanii]MCW8470851.1 hypothetical protein [Fluoribacter gormanii]SIQ99012.1 hypothetical protein SAMN05421777_10553 [Fluoribacter gormanii]STO26026.1 Uncharacterised protein [Fluoribacter gormanii]
MTDPVKLTQTIQDLIVQLGAINPTLVTVFANKADIDVQTIIDWFAQTRFIKSDENTFFLVTSLRASLLKELNKSLNPGAKEEETTKTPMSAKAKYALLALAGTIYFGCEGFDGITAFMGIFSSIPTIAIFAGGLVFSIVSVIVFCSFDLVEISKNLGVKSSETPQLIDAALEEFKEIKAIRARLTRLAKQDKTQEELDEYRKLALMLLQRHLELNKVRGDLTLASDNPYLDTAKKLTAIFAGFIFFSGGFFAGQTVSLAIASLFVATMSATAWPIVVAAVGVGFAALAVYWFVERPGIENLISRWKGLDKEKIDELCKPTVVDKETEKLGELIHDINTQIKALQEKAADKAQINTMQEKIDRLEQEKNELSSKLAAAEEKVTQVSEQLKLKETQPIQQTLPAGVGKNVEPIDELEVSNPLHIHGNDGAMSAHRQLSLFAMKKSASTGNLRGLMQKDIFSGNSSLYS